MRAVRLWSLSVASSGWRSFDRDFGTVLSRLRTTGLIEEHDTSVALTEAGKLVFDLVNWMFYPQAAKDWMAGRDRRFGEA